MDFSLQIILFDKTPESIISQAEKNVKKIQKDKILKLSEINSNTYGK